MKSFINYLINIYQNVFLDMSIASSILLIIFANCVLSLFLQDYSLNIYLRQEWVDRRLQYQPFNNKKSQQIKLEDYMWDKIWTPDVFFRNEKRAAFHDITTPNRLIFLRDNGTLWYVSK